MSNNGWVCPKCGSVWSPQITFCSVCTTFSIYKKTTEFDPKKCSCHPSNGGSGICGCTLGGIKIS